MVRVIIGILLILTFPLAIVGFLTEPEYKGLEALYIIGSFFFYFIPGALLLYFGRKYLKNRSLVGELSLNMIREKGFIEADILAQRALLSEIRVREIVEKLKQKGIIPSDVNVR